MAEVRRLTGDCLRQQPSKWHGVNRVKLFQRFLVKTLKVVTDSPTIIVCL